MNTTQFNYKEQVYECFIDQQGISKDTFLIIPTGNLLEILPDQVYALRMDEKGIMHHNLIYYYGDDIKDYDHILWEAFKAYKNSLK